MHVISITSSSRESSTLLQMERHISQIHAIREQLSIVMGLSELLRESAPTNKIWISYGRIRAAALAMDSILGEHERKAQRQAAS
jgi:hypothetical protein